MSDNTYVWPRERWMRKPKYHDQGVVQAVLSEHATIARYEGDERYVDHHHYIDADIYNSAEAYWKHQNENLMAEVTRLRKDAIKDKARVEELEAALVKSRRIMASRQPDKLSDGVYICDKALKGGAE